MMINDEPSSSSSFASSTDLQGLAYAFGRAEAQLNIVDEVSRSANGCPGLTPDQEHYFAAVFERLTTHLLGEMVSISDRASQISARTPEDLAAKSRIWLGRWLPEPDNDVLELAHSICKDICSASKPGRDAATH